MQNENLINHNAQRKEVWIKAWCSCASAWNCKNTETADRWADDALKSFDSRFPAPTELKKIKRKTITKKLCY